MSRPPEVCGHCGAKTVEYKHRMNVGLVRALAALAKASIKTRPDVLASSLPLDHAELANLQKLQYWGLISPAAHGPEDRKRGRWTVEEIGFAFLEARAPISRTAVTYRGETVRFDGKDAWVGDVVEGFQFVRDYAETAEPVGSGAGVVQLELQGVK
jgi:hypothetical protein